MFFEPAIFATTSGALSAGQLTTIKSSVSLCFRRNTSKHASEMPRIRFVALGTRVILFAFRLTEGVSPMEWTAPQHEEIDLNCEISSYANAEL